MIKRYAISIFMIVVLALTGCSSSGPTMQVASVVEDKQAGTGEVKDEQTSYKVTEEDFKTFFTKYFSLSEEDILALNQRPTKVTPAYWESYENYKKKLIELIGSYLTDEAKKNLQEQHLDYGFDLPKMLQIQGYVTFGPAVIEKAEIISYRALGENLIYEIAVTTKNSALDVIQANKVYKSDYEKNYYVKVDASQEGSSSTFGIPASFGEDPLKTFLFLQETPDEHQDEIRLLQKYWVEVVPGTSFKIQGVKEASPMEVDEERRHLANNTKYIIKLPYTDVASAKDEAVIKEVFLKLFSQTRDFYNYYDRAINQDYDTFKTVWESSTALNLSGKVIIPKECYKNAFDSALNPYKDNIVKLEVNEQMIKITPSLYGTKKQPRFNVHIPVKALLTNNDIRYYDYSYLTGLELGSVEFISYKDIVTRDEQWYNTGVVAGEDNEVAEGTDLGVEPAVSEAASTQTTEQ